MTVGVKVIMGDSSGKTTRAYDELNRCIIKNVPKVGSSTFEYSTIVDEGGVKYLAELFIDPTGKTTKTLLDKAGRPTLVIDPDGNKTKIEYYANGLKWKITQPGGATEVYTYFKDGTLKELKNTYGGKTDTYTYTYDAAGNQLTKVEPQGSTTYTYDRLNRLIKVVEPTPEGQRTTEYAYDKAGNRIRQVVQTGSSSIMATSYEYNEQNRLVSTTEETLGAGGVKAVETPGSKRAFIEYIYDNNGNLLYQKKAELTKLDPIAPAPKAHFSAFVMGQTTVEENPMVAWIGSNKYNAFNELIQSTQGGKAVSNGYNGEGLRVSKTVMGQTTNTLYISDNPVLETDNSGKETGRTTYGAGIALSRKAGSETLGYLYNGHADVVALINSGGTAQATYTYDAFGVPLSSTGTAKNPIRYGGYEFDEETGYYYLKARFYDPKTARFLQEDTFRGNPTDPLSLNLYSYCSNNPVIYWDPTGHVQDVSGDGRYTASPRTPGKVNSNYGSQKDYRAVEKAATEKAARDAASRAAEKAAADRAAANRNTSERSVSQPTNNSSTSGSSQRAATPSSSSSGREAKDRSDRSQVSVPTPSPTAVKNSDKVDRNGSISYSPITAINNSILISSKVGVLAVNGSIKTSQSGIIRTSDMLKDFFLPTTSEQMTATKMAEKALAGGAKDVKALTGAKTVSSGRYLLGEMAVVGKVTRVIGVAGTFITPITEYGTSRSLFNEDLSLIQEYTPERYQEAKMWAEGISILDASSFGFGRSVLNTVPTVIQLVPGEDPLWTQNMIDCVNNNVNAKIGSEYVVIPIYEGIRDAFE